MAIVMMIARNLSKKYNCEIINADQSQMRKELNINEAFTFSLDIPEEYLKNFLKFFFVPDSIFMEKSKQIQTLRIRIENIIEALKSSK